MFGQPSRLFRHNPGRVGALPGTGWMKPSVKNHFIAFLGEFVGTVLFLFFAFGGTQVAHTNNVEIGSTSTKMVSSDTSILLYIALSFGFSLAVNAWVFFRISGGLFNPAVTYGMLLVGLVHPLRAFWVVLAQILGGIAAAALVSGLLPGELTASTALTSGTSILRGLFIEMFCTAMLVFTIFMLAAEKHKATFIAPIGIGLALFIGELVGVFYTGGSLNPARSFGPAVATANFPGYHWIYWVGPGLGSMLAAAFYKFIKVLEYETANPDQDGEYDTKKPKEMRHRKTAQSAAEMTEVSSNTDMAERGQTPTEYPAAHPAAHPAAYVGAYPAARPAAYPAAHPAAHHCDEVATHPPSESGHAPSGLRGVSSEYSQVADGEVPTNFYQESANHSQFSPPEPMGRATRENVPSYAVE